MPIGTTLRSARVQRGLSIEQAAQETRISARFLEALEDEAFGELPAPVYVRGFLRSYANFLRIDATALLAQLDAGAGRPIAGPDSFVGGPKRPARPASDPFQRAPAPPLPPPAAMPPEDFATDTESWDPEDIREDAPVRPLSGRFYENEPHASWPAEPEPVRQRRVAGVLLEREAGPGDEQRGARMLAIVGGAIIVVLFALAAAAILTRGGGGDSNAALPAVTPTATSRPGTVIAVGSATASASASASASPAGTPGTVTPGATGTPGTPTATSQPGTATATPSATATSLPPTATPVPATATPTPPPATATPTIAVPPHGLGFSECTALPNNEYNCGEPPFRVVCYPPSGSSPAGWFVDVGKNFDLSGLVGWRDALAPGPSPGSAVKVGGSGC